MVPAYMFHHKYTYLRAVSISMCTTYIWASISIQQYIEGSLNVMSYRFNVCFTAYPLLSILVYFLMFLTFFWYRSNGIGCLWKSDYEAVDLVIMNCLFLSFLSLSLSFFSHSNLIYFSYFLLQVELIALY